MDPREGVQSSAVIRFLAGAGLAGACLLAAGACGQVAEPAEGAAGGATVRAGVQVLLQDSIHLVRGLRVGLITNHTGIARAGDSVRSSIDLIHEHPDVELVALFGPEHGLRGQVVGGETVSSGVDDRTGVVVHSLYGGTGRRKPTPEMLEGVEALLFDIQDIGSRYYTYQWTMTLAMEAAAEAGIPFLVLDRPNPIGGTLVQGNVLDPAFATFVGRYPVPMRPGMTPGEMARLVHGAFSDPAHSPAPELANPILGELELHVLPAHGWERWMGFEDTGLPWVATSLNMPDPVSALHYVGTCLFEGTVLSVGRGTPLPFQQLGHPDLDATALVAALDGYGFADVIFEPVSFTPERPDDGKFPGQQVHGVRLVATGPSYDPARVAVAILVEAHRLLGDGWSWTGTMDRLAGTDLIREGVEAGEGVGELTADWDAQLARFRELRANYLLYR